jgi:hypothetical protein
MLLENYGDNNLVVVKIDTNGGPEMGFLMQILNDTQLSNMIDHLYFEHHIHLRELASSWRRTMVGTIKDSLDIFEMVSEKGVAAHFWV